MKLNLNMHSPSSQRSNERNKNKKEAKSAELLLRRAKRKTQNIKKYRSLPTFEVEQSVDAVEVAFSKTMLAKS